MVSANLPASSVDNTEFRELLDFCNPLASKFQMSRRTLSTKIEKQYDISKQLVQEEIASVHKISITWHLWTAPNNLPILGITAQSFSTESWQSRERLLEMLEVEGSRSGENIAAYLLTCLSDFNIQGCLFYITADNASSNTTLLHHRKGHIVFLH